MEVGGKRISQNRHKNRASPYALSKHHTLPITYKRINLSPERFCFWYSYKLSDHQNYTLDHKVYHTFNKASSNTSP